VPPPPTTGVRSAGQRHTQPNPGGQATASSVRCAAASERGGGATWDGLSMDAQQLLSLLQ
jgi:hypothetical protein